MRSVVVLCAFATLCGAQAISTTNLPHFEVATIKPASTREIGGAYTYPGGRVAFRGATFLHLVQLAFDLQEFQISGAEPWMRTERFDIDATVPTGSQSSNSNPSMSKIPMNAEQRLMLQSLLAERFRLTYQEDTTVGPIYLLTRNGKSLNMAEAKDVNAFPWSGSIAGGAVSGDGFRGINESMPDLAHRLSSSMGRTVVDQTGLTGSFDFETRYYENGQPTDLVGMLLTCLDDLGLRLESSRGEVAGIAIEQASNTPTAN